MSVDFETIKNNDSILSPKYYLNVLPKLKETLIFNNVLTGVTYKMKLDLDNLDLNTKLLIFDLLKAREKLNRIIKYTKEGLKE